MYDMRFCSWLQINQAKFPKLRKIFLCTLYKWYCSESNLSCLFYLAVCSIWLFVLCSDPVGVWQDRVSPRVYWGSVGSQSGHQGEQHDAVPGHCGGEDKRTAPNQVIHWLQSKGFFVSFPSPSFSVKFGFCVGIWPAWTNEFLSQSLDWLGLWKCAHKERPRPGLPYKFFYCS